jgi:hypothetical protein
MLIAIPENVGYAALAGFVAIEASGVAALVVWLALHRRRRNA